MAKLTVGQVLLQVDALLPNQYTAEEKRRWLKQAEGFVIEEVIKVHEGGENCRLLEEWSDDTELLVGAPYDELYRYYVEAQIHYANGEMNRYNNACTAWNNALLTYRDCYCRSHLPRQHAKALHLC